MEIEECGLSAAYVVYGSLRNLMEAVVGILWRIVGLF